MAPFRDHAAESSATRDRRAVRDARGVAPGRIDLGLRRAPGTDQRTILCASPRPGEFRRTSLNCSTTSRTRSQASRCGQRWAPARAYRSGSWARACSAPNSRRCLDFALNPPVASLGSRAPAARSAPADRRRLLACPAADEDTSTGARAATDANDESSPAARTRSPSGHEEAPGPTRPGTPDRPDGKTAGPSAGEAPRARDARRVSRPRSRPLTGNATQPIRGDVETASRSMR